MKGSVDITIFLDVSVNSYKHEHITHNQIDTNTLKHTNTHTHTHYHYNQEMPGCFCHIFAPSFYCTVNMTLSPSLLANGHQLGSSELILSHCIAFSAVPVKLST